MPTGASTKTRFSGATPSTSIENLGSIVTTMSVCVLVTTSRTKARNATESRLSRSHADAHSRRTARHAPPVLRRCEVELGDDRRQHRAEAEQAGREQEEEVVRARLEAYRRQDKPAQHLATQRAP